MHLGQQSGINSKKERKYRRFDLQFPVSLSFPMGEERRELSGVSRNVSIGGLLVRADRLVAIDTEVNLTMEVAGPSARRAVRLLGEGKVVRVEPLGAVFDIAVECKQPLKEIEDHFPAAG
jgi:hypothetical protein